MIIVKLSYSILAAWSGYRWEDAIGYYRGKDLPATEEMKLGRLKHELWAMHTQRTGKLHRDLGNYPLINPVVEQKFEKLIPLSDNISILLRGVPDLLADHPDGGGLITYEYKVGSQTATDYIDELQLDYYKLLVPDLIEGRYLCYDPYFKTRTVGVKFLTEANALNALEHIITYGGEIIDYLQANKLLINYKGGKYDVGQGNTGRLPT